MYRKENRAAPEAVAELEKPLRRGADRAGLWLLYHKENEMEIAFYLIYSTALAIFAVEVCRAVDN